MAEALAASIPPHLAKLTSPPISWMQIGNDVTVILADGRKFTSSIQKINELMSAKTLPVESAAPVLVQPPAVAHPVHDFADLFLASRL